MKATRQIDVLHRKNFVYRSAAQTDIRQTFRRIQRELAEVENKIIDERKRKVRSLNAK